MRNLFLVICMFPILVLAQDFIRIEETAYGGFGKEGATVFQVEVDLVERKALMKHWESFLKKQTKNDIEASENELRTQKFPFKTTGGKPVNVFMHFEDMENGTRSYIAFEDSATGFITLENKDYGIAIKKILYDETKKVYTTAKREVLEKEQDLLGDLESDYEKLRGKEEKLRKNILKAEQEIDKTKNDIKINEGVLEETTNDVATRRSELNSLTASTPEEVRKTAEKELKNAEKKRDKLRKKLDSDRETIYDLENDIRDINYEIDKLKPDMEIAKRKVDDQRKVVTDLQEEIYQLEQGR